MQAVLLYLWMKKTTRLKAEFGKVMELVTVLFSALASSQAYYK